MFIVNMLPLLNTVMFCNFPIKFLVLVTVVAALAVVSEFKECSVNSQSINR